MNEQTRYPHLSRTQMVSVAWNLVPGQPGSHQWREEAPMTLDAALKGGHLKTGTGTRHVRVTVVGGEFDGAAVFGIGRCWYANVQVYSDGSPTPA